MCSHQPQIVRDEQIGQLQPRLQIHQQIDHLGLHRDVQRRDRLVGDDERRIERERAREADALPLAAAELVRVADRGDRGSARRARTARATRAWRSGLRSQPWMMSGSSTMAPTRMRGLSDEYGSWKTICMSRRARRSSPRENASTLRPSNSTSPEVGSISRRMQRPVVVLPLPDSPTRPKVSPSLDPEAHVVHGMDRRASGRTGPRVRENAFDRWRTSRSGIRTRASVSISAAHRDSTVTACASAPSEQSSALVVR